MSSAERYNFDHYPSGIGWGAHWAPPAALHFGHAQQLHAQRQLVLEQAYKRHPERFVSGPPKPPAIPDQVWINQPTQLGSPD